MDRPLSRATTLLSNQAFDIEHQVNTSGRGFPIANGRRGFPIASGPHGVPIANGRRGFPIANGPTGPA
jgi:hypothetical protein